MLRTVCEPITELKEFHIELVHDMLETVHAMNGIGLSAPQVGYPIRLAVVCVYDTKEGSSILKLGDQRLRLEPLVLVNPEFTPGECGPSTLFEGCLSIPRVYAPVTRHLSVNFTAMKPDRSKVEMYAQGLISHVIQHEIDHLDGKLFIDKMDEKMKAHHAPALLNQRLMSEKARALQ